MRPLNALERNGIKIENAIERAEADIDADNERYDNSLQQSRWLTQTTLAA